MKFSENALRAGVSAEQRAIKFNQNLICLVAFQATVTLLENVFILKQKTGER